MGRKKRRITRLGSRSNFLLSHTLDYRHDPCRNLGLQLCVALSQREPISSGLAPRLSDQDASVVTLFSSRPVASWSSFPASVS